jgi:uncharacterized protein (TIGR02246 family)
MNEYEAVRHLIASQTQLRDDMELDQWAENWADDAVLVSGGSEHRGRAAIRAAAGPADPSREWASIHFLSEPAIVVDGERAQATTDFVQIVARPDGDLAIRGVYRYHDQFVQRDGRWYFSHRRATVKHRANAVST